MAICRNFSIHIKVIEQGIFPCDLMLIGCYLFIKDAKGWVAITFFDITKHLIIGAVFLDDINAILNGAGVTDFSGDGITTGPLGHWKIIRLKRAARIRFLGEGDHFLGCGHIQNPQRTLHKTCNILPNGKILSKGIGPLRIRPRG